MEYHIPLDYSAGRSGTDPSSFYDRNWQYSLFLRYDKKEIPTLCAARRKDPMELGQALWNQKIPILLTSGSLLAGNGFDWTRQVMGLSENQRVCTFSAASPFQYEQNCLMYLLDCPLKFRQATWGHTLVLHPSYALMGTVFRQLKDLLSFL